MMHLLFAGLVMAAAEAVGPEFTPRLLRHGLKYEGTVAYGPIDDRDWGTAGSRRFYAEAGAARLRIVSEFDPDERSGKRRLFEWRARFIGQFDGEAAYPGMMTRTLRTPDSLRPREISAASGRKVWLAPATERLTFGAGAEDLVSYWAIVSHRWCRLAGRSVEIELFFPVKSFRRKTALMEEAAFSCRAQ